MNTKRMVVAGLVAIAAVAAGCGNNKSITGPSNDGWLSNSAPENTAPGVARMSGVPIKLMAFEGTLLRVEIEGGCWILKSDKGDEYEPRFDTKSPKLDPGSRLAVKGYIVPDANSVCMIGPIFRITSYEVIEPIHTSRPVPADQPIILSGIFGQTKDGCYFLTSSKMGNVGLKLYFSPAPWVIGRKVQVSGEWSTEDYLLCGMARVLNVGDLTVFDSDDDEVEY